MSFTPASPVTGGAQTGFTSPTYTLTEDVAPTNLGKQFAVTALGGTQTGVTLHSVSSPFTVTFTRPRAMKQLGPANSSGYIASVPRNVYKLIIRKGVTPAADQPEQTMLIDCAINVPAGADVNDDANIRAAISLLVGVLNGESSDVGDTLINGVL